MRVPANADVDHVGRFDANGYDVVEAGLLE